MMDFKMQVVGLVVQMMIEEQVLLFLGDGWWCIYGVEWLGLVFIYVFDGLYGLCKVDSGYGDVVFVICFFMVLVLVVIWNMVLICEVGVVFGCECQVNDVQVLFGFGINIKCLLLGGCNFEYFSEDLLFIGCLVEVYIVGVQGEGVGILLKYFVVNSQEMWCMFISFEVDVCMLYEIYLFVFEMVVNCFVVEQFWMVMSLYNLVNGIYVFEYYGLLIDILCS